MASRIKMLVLPNVQAQITGVANITQKGKRAIVMYTNSTYDEGTLDSDINSWNVGELIRVIQTQNINQAIKF
jgi:hypothetical protein